MKNALSSAPAPAVSTRLRRYLYLTAAVNGAAVMIVEILGAKMLSPYLGMSHFVWVAQIAVTLVALSCGYYVGGRLADRSQNLAWLYWAVIGAASYLTLTVVCCEPVAYWCLDRNTTYLGVAALLASSILFFVPLALLAMTGPFLVRVITSSVNGVGGNVGRLSSVSTVGSFAGTLLIGYLLLPLLPNSATMYFTAMTLLVVCAIYFGVFARKWAVALAVVLGLTLIAGLLMLRSGKRQYTQVDELFRGNSYFGQLQVVAPRSVPGVYYYLNDYLYQDGYDTISKQSVCVFTYMLEGLARAYTTNVNDVLCIGMGIGIVPMNFARKGAHVDVVEINPAAIPVASKFFDLKPEMLNVTIDDGRHFLNRCRKQYDVVVLDAFLGDCQPSHLMTREAFAAMKQVLRPGGTLVINAFAEVTDGKDFFAASLERTLKTVFKSVKIHDSDGQIYLAATDRANPAFVHEPDLSSVYADPKVREDVEWSMTHIVQTIPNHGMVLTDDYNPIDFYDAANREDTRRKLARLAKSM